MKGIFYLTSVLIFNIGIYNMKDMNFEELLGKPFSVVEVVIGTDFRNNENLKLKTNFYSSINYVENDYYGMPNHHITILVDEKDAVKSITVHFRKVIDHEFYYLFIKDYGEPNHIQIIENRQILSESFTKDDNGEIINHLKKSTFDLREGAFEEKPLYIIWEKENFQIKAFIRHKQNISEVTFSLASN